MKIWKKVTALVLSLAMTLSASATVLAQAPSIKEGHVTTTASVTNDGIKGYAAINRIPFYTLSLPDRCGIGT